MTTFQVNESGKINKRVIFFLGGWKTKPWTLWLLLVLLARNSFYCIVYTYQDDVLSPDTKKTVVELTKIKDHILSKINLLKQVGFSDFSVFGTSLGSVIALMVANQSTDIKKIVLNTTGIDIAETIWSWDKINPKFKDKLLKQGFSLTKLQSAWQSINPAENIDKLKEKSILIYLSKKDEVIPFSLGQKLVNEFKGRNYNFRLIVNEYLNHSATGAFNLLNSSSYIRFLKQRDGI